MLTRRLAAAAATLLLCSAAASAAQTLKPLRQLVFDVTYSAHSKRATKSSGLMNGDPRLGQTRNVNGSGTNERQIDGSDTGKLTVDVVAATTEGALVVDASFAGINSQPPVRVVVFSDGRLSWNPALTLSPPAQRVLPLLARGFTSDKDVSPGSSWSIPAPAPQRGELTYRVRHVDGDRATIEIEGTRGTSGSEEYQRASTVYATDLLAPISLALDAHIHRQIAVDDALTTEAHLTATLVSDTFAKK
ncbi:MAG: hypothetical protein QOJ39_2844 [Candidatus Eremiobacteraeota bacterium]|nr:hypothetical protein [Candidatus Eremiobacteraeota bacterium]